MINYSNNIKNSLKFLLAKANTQCIAIILVCFFIVCNS